jgi:hypothetical protein
MGYGSSYLLKALNADNSLLAEEEFHKVGGDTSLAIPAHRSSRERPSRESRQQHLTGTITAGQATCLGHPSFWDHPGTLQLGFNQGERQLKNANGAGAAGASESTFGFRLAH